MDRSDVAEAKGLEVVGTELDREAEFADGLSVLGRLDLLVRHPTEGLGVIDLKWTKSAKRRRTELAEGRALQLATYGAIADQTDRTVGVIAAALPATAIIPMVLVLRPFLPESRSDSVT